MKLHKIIIPIVTSIIISFSTITASAAVIDSLVEQQHVAEGIEYSKVEQLTSNGFVDINLLTIDLENPNVNFDILRNPTSFGVQANLTTLVGDTAAKNVVGAVNGSFFHMDTTPTDVIGYEYRNDQWVFAKETYNKTKLEENSIIVSKDNEVSFDYLQANTTINNSNGDTYRIVTINGTRDLINLTLITPYMMADTTQVESLGNIYKFVIQNDTITYIGKPKEVVKVPADGYVLTANYNQGLEMLPKFPVGAKVSIKIKTNFDDILGNTSLLMSGAGTLLKDGVVKTDGLTASPTSRQPRTAVGVSKDGNTLYVVAVDGRGRSIGMTNAELSQYLLSIGAHNAINLDGGGSTTFAVREEGTTQTKVVNTVSDGAQRKVINGFGVLSSPTSEMVKLHVTPSTEKTLVGEKTTFTAYGLDINDNPIPIDNAQVVYQDSLSTDEATKGNSLVFDTEGVKVVNATYNGVSGQTLVEVFGGDNAEVIIKSMSVPLNGSKEIEITATTKNGDLIKIDPKNYNFVTAGDIRVENGVVHAGKTKGMAQITTTINNRTITQNISVGDPDVYIPVTSFENMKITGKAYPGGKEGGTGVYKEKPIQGQFAIKTSFNFTANGKAQAVYSILPNVKLTDTRAQKLAVNYFGDNKGNSVKAVLVDAKGTEKVVIFTNNVNFNGYKRLEVAIPNTLVYPITVQRLYVASDGKTAKSGVGYFDYLTYTIGSSYEAALNNIDLPIDSLNTNVGNYLFDVKKYASNVNSQYYTSQVVGDTKLIKVSADNGGLVYTNSEYYPKLRNELNSTGQKNIVIQTSQSVDTNTFTIPQEGKMLKNLFENMQTKYDKNIFVVNAHANNNSTTVDNKIRYINLYNKDVAFYINSDGNVTYHSK